MSERVELPEEVFVSGAIRLHQAITSRARLVILQHLLHHPESTFADLDEALDMSVPMIRASMRQLREHGYVIESGGGGRRALHFTADRSLIAADLGALMGALLG